MEESLGTQSSSLEKAGQGKELKVIGNSIYRKKPRQAPHGKTGTDKIMSKRLSVANLPPRDDRSTVADLFAEAGSVDSAKIIPYLHN